LAFSLAQESIGFHPFGKISATLVFQLKVNKSAGGEFVLRPCAKSLIMIPIEAERNTLEQEARSNNVYKAHRGPISKFETSK
jgi:hypothetical protein